MTDDKKPKHSPAAAAIRQRANAVARIEKAVAGMSYADCKEAFDAILAFHPEAGEHGVPEDA